MKNRTTPSPRITGVVIVYLLFLLLALALCFQLGFPWITRPLTALTHSPETPDAASVVTTWIHSVTQTILFPVLPAITLFVIVWGGLLIYSVHRRYSRFMATPTPGSRDIAPSSQTPFPSPAPVDRIARETHDRRMFLHLLSLFQREGRLVDFFQENLDLYEDAQIGAAVRGIHESCRKVMDRHIRPQPILDQEEGESITLNQGFDADMIKLVGNVGDHPPFHGIIRHKGWKAGKRDLPELSGTPEPSVIIPAEVELS